MAEWFHLLAASRNPDFIIGDPSDPYVERWYVIPRNPVFNIYLHHFLHSDEDEALHDHPWFNLSVLLEGAYIEETIKAGGVHRRNYKQPGSFQFRTPWRAHRVELLSGLPCWSLFFTGPVIRRWGFHCKNGWRYWKDFVSRRTGGNKRGKGCG